MPEKLSIDDIEERLKIVHGNLVFLDKSTYKNTMTKCLFIDIEYGEWWAKPNKVIWAKQSHPKRKGIKISNKLTGVKKSKQHIKNMSLCRIGKLSGENNPMFGRKHTSETINKISSIVCDQINNGRNIFSNHKKGYFHSNKLDKDIWYDSSYELKALDMFDKDDNIIYFSRSMLKIPYEYENKQKFTIPDFKVIDVCGQEKIIEVKPKGKLEKIELERIKIQHISNYCKDNNYIFEVWTEKELNLLTTNLRGINT